MRVVAWRLLPRRGDVKTSYCWEWQAKEILVINVVDCYYVWKTIHSNKISFTVSINEIKSIIEMLFYLHYVIYATTITWYEKWIGVCQRVCIYLRVSIASYACSDQTWSKLISSSASIIFLNSCLFSFLDASMCLLIAYSIQILLVSYSTTGQFHRCQHQRNVFFSIYTFAGHMRWYFKLILHLEINSFEWQNRIFFLFFLLLF